MRVNGVQSTLSSITMLLSPAISGAILSAASIEAIFLIDVVTAAIGIAITLTVDVPFQPADRAESPLRQIGRGFGYLRGHLFVRRLLLSQVAVLILISPSAFLTPLMVSRTFGDEVWYLTASEMTFSLGKMCIRDRTRAALPHLHRGSYVLVHNHEIDDPDIAPMLQMLTAASDARLHMESYNCMGAYRIG